jgi:WD40 repeat protein
MSMAPMLALLVSHLALLDEPAIYSPDLANCASVVFSKDGDWLATGGFDGQVKLWSATSCLGTRELGKHDGEVRALAVSDDGKQLASGDVYKRIELWSIGSRSDPSEPKRLRAMSASGAVDALAFSGDNRWLLAGTRDNSVLVFDLADEAMKDPRELRHDFEVGALAVAPDGKHFASGDGGGTVRVWTLPDCADPMIVKQEGRITALAYSRDGSTLFVATAGPKLRAIESATGKDREGFAALDLEANALSIDRAGNRLFAAGQDAKVRTIEAASGKVTETIEDHEGPVIGVAIAPDDSLLVSCGLDRLVRVRRLR